MKPPHKTRRPIGILALALLAPVPAVLAGRVELPAWKDDRAPGAFQLGGGLWPESSLPATNKDLDKLPPLPVPLPDGMSKSKPEDFDEEEHKTIVVEDDEPRPKTLREFRVPDKIDLLTLEETPDFPPVTDELRDEYFALRPVEYLIDPQELLTEQKANDVRRFLEYHAEAARFDIYLMLFAGPQEIPSEITLARRHADWFGSEPAVTVAYFMEQPERTVIEFSEEVRKSLPEAVFQRIFQSCVREAQVSQNSSDQVERLSIELSIRLYWMAKLIERQSAGETISSTQEGLSEPWELAQEDPGVAAVTMPGARVRAVLQRLGGLPWAWIGSVAGILGAGLLTGFLVWRRDSLAAKPILFPDRNLPSRLGGEFSGGGYIGISFDVGGGSE